MKDSSRVNQLLSDLAELDIHTSKSNYFRNILKLILNAFNGVTSRVRVCNHSDDDSILEFSYTNPEHDLAKIADTPVRSKKEVVHKITWDDFEITAYETFMTINFVVTCRGCKYHFNCIASRELFIEIFEDCHQFDILIPLIRNQLEYFEINDDLSHIHIDSLTRVQTKQSLSSYLDTLESLNSCILIDVDNFKTVNDTLGHQTGDEVLAELGSILNEVVGESYLCFRFGGDEFLVIPQLEVTCDNLKEIAQLILNRFTVEATKKDFGVPLTLSIGIAHEEHSGKCAIQDMIARADKALYISKFLGKNQVTVATPYDLLYSAMKEQLTHIWNQLDRIDAEASYKLLYLICLPNDIPNDLQVRMSALVRKSDIVATQDNLVAILFSREVSEEIVSSKVEKGIPNCTYTLECLDVASVNNHESFIQLLKSSHLQLTNKLQKNLGE